VPLLAAMLVAGCAADSKLKLGGGEDNWGEANRQTMAAQIIDPAPHYDYSVPESSGDHAAQAIDRYRQDKVKKPDRVRTSTVLGGVSASGN